MGSASLRKSRVLALSLAAVVGTMTLAVSPVLAAPGTGPVASENVPAPDVNAGEAYTQFIVSFKKTPGNATPKGRANAWGKAARQQGVSVKELRALATGGTLIASDKALSDQAARDFMNGIAASGEVNAVEPDARMTAVLTPNDTRYGEQWDFTAANGMRIPGAWDVSTGSGSTVAVIDTGITAHPDLDANVLPGYDFVSDATAARDGNGRDANAQDQGDWYAAGECGQTAAANSSWHGTHVAGTVAAVTGNATGVAGVAPNAKVVPVRVLAKCGGSLSDIADAIIWASGGTVSGVPANANPAKVINMSLGGSGACGTTYQAAIDSAVSRGTTVVVAAGNSNQDASGFRPSNCSLRGDRRGQQPERRPVLLLQLRRHRGPHGSRRRHRGQRRRHPLHDQHRNHDARRRRLRQLPGHLDGHPARRRPRGPDEIQVPCPHSGPGRVHAPAGHPGHAGRLHQGLRRRPLRCHGHHGAARRHHPAAVGKPAAEPRLRERPGVLDLRPRGHV